MSSSFRLALCLVALCAGCASPFAPGVGLDIPPAGWPRQVELSLLVLGDTGRMPPVTRLFHRQRAVAAGVSAEDLREPADALLLLGDNFYWSGLQRHELVKRLRGNLVRPYCRFVSLDGQRSDQVRGACSTPRSERHPVPIYALLGDHDFKDAESPHLQRELVPEFVSNWYVPSELAEVVEFPGGVSLVLFDSTTFREGVALEPLIAALRRSEGPWRILAMHHPLGIARDQVGASAEVGSRYRARLREAIRRAGVPVQLALSGEEHNLQVIELLPPAPPLQIVSGSGSRVRELRTSYAGTRFAMARPGFARIDLARRGDELGIEASLFVTGSVHWWGSSQPRLVAHWRVGEDGRARNLFGENRQGRGDRGSR